MDYDSRRYLSPSLTYSDYYPHLALSHTTRSSPHGYPIGGPVGEIYGRLNLGRDDVPVEIGSARRRIAVACARCRKRKIRCSGDPGTGAGCTSCVMAGVDPTQCQFHRVGSDHLHKVIDGINMAHSLTNMASGNGMVPIYSGGEDVTCPRPLSAQQYTHDETKPQYPSHWTVPYSEDASPVENYQLDQSAMYLPNPTPMAIPSMYGTPYRWAHSTQKQPLHGPTGYVDQESTYPVHGLPYLQPSFRSNSSIDTRSPLSNMASLHVTLPERPIIRQSYAPGSVAPQRILPIPQPSPAQTSRVSFDLDHDQRLRSVQAIGTSATDEKPPFAKPLFSWSTEGDGHINGSEAAPTDALKAIASAHVPSTTEAAMDYIPSATSASNDGIAKRIAPHMQLNFSTSGLLDPMSATTPVSAYSNFRECRSSNSPPTRIGRKRSQSTLYSIDSNHSPKRTAIAGGTSSNGILASGLRYQPLPHSSSQASPGGKKSRRDAVSSRHASVHHGSIKNMNSSFQV